MDLDNVSLEKLKLWSPEALKYCLSIRKLSVDGTFDELIAWGIPIPGISKMRTQRIEAIGKELSKGEYHIVVLEEIWSQNDFSYLRCEVGQVMPYSHYFYSGAIGSGVCVFSKLPITETFFHRFHLNGQAYKVQHGDWFGGKGVGLCKLEFQGFKINLYATHIHAEYNRGNDEYLPHRVSQAFEMSQFIRHTTADCDLVMAAGDFNLESSDVGFKVLLTNTPLQDAWENKMNTAESNKSGSTCECPWNMFADKSLADTYPEGKRIDYILYCGQPGVDVRVEKCITTLGQVPGENFPFSDHEAVAAEFKISRGTSGERSTGTSKNNKLENYSVYLNAARDIMQTGMAQVKKSAVRFQLKALGLAVLLYWLHYTDVAHANPQPVPFLLAIVKVAVVVVVAALVWLALVIKRAEAQGIRATKLDLDRLIDVEKKSQ